MPFRLNGKNGFKILPKGIIWDGGQNFYPFFFHGVNKR